MPFQDLNRNLLRLGVGKGAHANFQPFDLGGAGQIDNEQVFDIEAPYVGVFNFQMFNIEGGIGTTNVQIFDLGEVYYFYNEQPFAILGDGEAVPGTPQPPPVYSNTTTLAQTAVEGGQTVVVTSTTGITTGSTIHIGNYSYLVTNVSGTTLTLSTPLLQTLPAGTAVFVYGVTIFLTAPANAGDSSLTVNTVAGLRVGMTVGIYSPTGAIEYRVIESLS